MNLTRLPRPRRWALASTAIVAASLIVGGVVTSAGSTASAALELHTLARPTRFVDTRAGLGAPAHQVGPAGFIDALVPGLPSDAKAVTLNITAVNGSQASSLKVYPTGTTAPVTSPLVWTPGSRVVTTVTVPIIANHKVRVLNERGSVDVVMAVEAYFTPAGVGGAEGPMGPQGPAGADGPMGPPGQNGSSAGPAGSVYVYASNASAQTVHRGVGNSITFDTKGATMGDVSFTSGTGAFTVTTAGVYKVTFWTMAEEDNQFDLRVNGQVPSMGLIVFGGLAHQATTGTAVLTLAADDVITMQNISSTGEPADAPILAGDVILSTQVGGSAGSINAWITIEQLNAPLAG